ncbi:sugar ABC transporter substrate-binding protein [Bacillaceae bacterium CLA-AA-H227]|uniref:Sugar ABC transporter substrate-binding protein n=1 Tax=Robertmurraya yapensis (ex Hitch et al 2024) TaxID=3133160 RepID=A0ACC6SFU1_9BACI
MVKKIKVVFLVILIISVITGCAQNVENSADSSTIDFTSPQFVETLAMNDYGSQLAEDKKINLNPAWYTFDQTREKLVLDFKSGSNEWDLVYVDSQWVPEFAQLGLVSPVEELIDLEGVEKENFNIDDFIDVHLDRQEYDGKTWSLPILSAYITLAYRTDLFESPVEKAAFKDNYGYELQVPKTYSEFMDVSEFFTRKKGDTLNGEILENDFYGTVHSNKRGSFLWHDYISYLVAFGGDIIFDPETMEPTWNSPENIETAKYYKELLKYQPPENINMTGGEATAVFSNGYAAMQIEFLNRLASVVDTEESKVSGKVQYTLPPSREGIKGREHAFLVNTNGFGIYSNSENKTEATNLLTEILSTEGQKWMTLNNPGYIPTRTSVWEDPEVKQAYPEINEYVNEVENVKPYTFAHPQLPEYPQASEIAITSLHEILSGADVEETLNAAQEELEELFKSAGYIN